MEMSLASRPLSFNNGVLRTRFPISTFEKTFLPSSSTSNSNSSPSSLTGCREGRRRIIAFPVITASKTTPSSRQTLSSHWDVSQDLRSVTSSPWMPRLEDLDTTNMILRQRIIFLGSQVDDVIADFVISQLLFLDAEDPKKDIKLFINSPGGSVTAGMGIYDAMKLCKADVSTVCLGLAASMGAFLLASGTKGKRFCMPNARVMIHQPLGTSGGKATEMSIRIREMVYHKIKLNKILSRVTGKPLEQVELDTDRDNFMNPWEAKEYGLIDEVIDDGKPGLVAPTADAAPPPKTKVWDMWKVEGSRKAKKNLPSESKILENGSKGGQSEKETPASV
ncbi:ATP-dependent Clp protease proteolytic subunit 3 [Morus notabilis]|uniref:ATP-dependent Clp protease proteolytic subunit n=1 Tax=Morus notabilis TaxID=981085 RepID=W9R0I5_9ROSA|nr:ATP-dependent Clp protease proteolytic subunit 3, chloroplastic [Morus notabilis]EXB62703.1 ATP-dependent Clp protease proteolytic subunit 3 [Morus notabilis]